MTFTGFTHPVCTRRAAVQAGSIGLLGLGMNHLPGLRALGADAGRAPRNRPARAVIYLFLSGGLAQHDSFDLKPEAADTIRGEFQPIATATPGLRICEHLPKLAQRSHLWALCRSLTHSTNDHSLGHHIMLTGQSSKPAGFDASKPTANDHPSIASIVTQMLPPCNNLPPAIVLPETLIHRTARVIPGQFAGAMGPRYDPWILSASPFNAKTYGAYPEYEFHHETGKADSQLTFQAPNLTLPDYLTDERLSTRLDLLQALDEQRRTLEEHATTENFDRHRQQAIALLADRRVQKAFDVRHAEPREQDRYGRHQFGWSLLMAKRLVEAGVSLVQVNLGNNETWDTHQAAFPNLKNFLLPPLDQSVSALLDDLHASGLLESTLVVMAGEFGRTPRISLLPGVKLPGRDHWGAVQTVWFAGGGVPGGTVVGSSDKIGGYPASEPQTPENLGATIYQALGIPATAAWRDPAERPHFLYQGEPIFQKRDR